MDVICECVWAIKFNGDDLKALKINDQFSGVTP